MTELSRVGGAVEVHGAARAVEGRVVGLDDMPRAEARLGIGGPLDGKVLRSGSSRLDYRQPTMTVVTDFDSGLVESASIDAEPLLTYLPKTITVLGVRQYRIWILEKVWDQIITPEGQSTGRMEEFRAEVLLRLIDASPNDCRACRQLP